MICHYEVLGLARTATESEIKKAYRKKALELHPDKNINRMDEATREFTIVQEAYEVLSSPQERAWYDRNRDAIIRGRTRDTMDHLSKDDLMPYFSLSCFNGINDNNDGFFSIYRDLFMLIQAQERESIDHEHDAVASNFVYCNDFGNSESSYDYIKDFYDRFMFFSTAKSFFFVDEFNIATIDDRRIRRMAEAKNKKLRDSARKQFNETVCSLAAWIRKRDPRILARQQLQSEKERIRIEKLKTKQEEERLERNKKREAYQEAEWTKVDEPEFIEDEDLEINMYECVVCNKVFKSEKQLENHSNSKRHKENLNLLKMELDLDEEAFEEIEDDLTPSDDSETEKRLVQSFESMNSLQDSYVEPELSVDSFERVSKDSAAEPLSDRENQVSEPQKLKPKKKRRRATKETRAEKDPFSCNTCRSGFSSKTKLFDHIRQTGHALATPK